MRRFCAILLAFTLAAFSFGCSDETGPSTVFPFPVPTDLKVSGSIKLADVAVHPSLGGIVPSLLDYSPFELTVQDDPSINTVADQEGRFSLDSMSIREQYVIFCKNKNFPGFVLEYMAAESDGLYGEHQIEISIRSTARSLVARCLRDRYGRRINPQALGPEHISTTVDAIAEVLEEHPEKISSVSLDQVEEVKTAYTKMADSLNAGESGIVPSQWVLMFYMAADNDLSTFVAENIADLEDAGLPDNTQILVQVDYPVHGMKRMFLQDDEWFELGAIKDIDSSSPMVLADFVAFARRSFPAANYALIISSHADAWKSRQSLRSSLIQDQTSGKKGNPLEIAGWLKGANTQFGGFERPLELLVFDACNMAMIEIAYEFKDIAIYTVFSQAFVPGSGFPYSRIMKSFGDSSINNLTPYEAGKIFCDQYRSQYIAELFDAGGTVSMIENSKISNFTERLQSFMAKINLKMDEYGQVLVSLRDSRIKSEDEMTDIEDGEDNEENEQNQTDESENNAKQTEYQIQAFEFADYRDLKDFVSQTRNTIPDAKIEADLFLQSYSDLVVINYHSPIAFPRASGLSIGFPDKATWLSSYVSSKSLNYLYFQFNQNTAWGQILAILNQ
jgi:hypothetical protein